MWRKVRRRRHNRDQAVDHFISLTDGGTVCDAGGGARCNYTECGKAASGQGKSFRSLAKSVYYGKFNDVPDALNSPLGGPAGSAAPHTVRGKVTPGTL
jgi:hypothetical protein